MSVLIFTITIPQENEIHFGKPLTAPVCVCVCVCVCACARMSSVSVLYVHIHACV